jgi:protein MpaA
VRSGPVQVARRILAGVRWLLVALGAAVAVAGAGPAPARREHLLGRSVQGRPITAVELRAPGARTTALVVGCIHGDERAGIAVARHLAAGAAPAGTDLWVVPDLNPDGAAADTRQNAHGVDLNRNFPSGWRALGRRGDQQYSGPHALSEPESRIARRLILRLRPKVTVWLHQPLGVTDESGGDLRLERRFAALSGLPLRRLPRYPGSAATWQNQRLRPTTAFVVELPPGSPTRGAVARYARAIRAVAH